MVWHLLELPQHVREQLRPAQDDVPQVAGDLASHCQQRVWVFIEFFRQSPDGRLRRWRYLVPLDLAQIRRLHPDALGDLADREGSILAPSPRGPFEHDFRMSRVRHSTHFGIRQRATADEAGEIFDRKNGGLKRENDEVPGARLELARCRQRWILSPLRLPIPPSRHKAGISTRYYRADKRNGKGGPHIQSTLSITIWIP